MYKNILVLVFFFAFVGQASAQNELKVPVQPVTISLVGDEEPQKVFSVSETFAKGVVFLRMFNEETRELGSFSFYKDQNDGQWKFRTDSHVTGFVLMYQGFPCVYKRGVKPSAWLNTYFQTLVNEAEKYSAQ